MCVYVCVKINHKYLQICIEKPPEFTLSSPQVAPPTLGLIKTKFQKRKNVERFSNGFLIFSTERKREGRRVRGRVRALQTEKQIST